MPTVDRSPLSRREIEIVVAWVRSGFTIAGHEREPWAERLIAKLRGAWANASDVAEPIEHPPPRDYKVPQHQHTPLFAEGEVERVMDGARQLADRVGLDPAQRCRMHVAEIYARFDASRAVMLASLRMREAVVDWGANVHANVAADGDVVIAVNSISGERRLLWDPDADPPLAWCTDAAERQRVLDGTDPVYTPRERSRKGGKDVRISPGPTQRSADPSLPQDSDRK